MTDKEEIDFAFNWIDDHENDMGFLPANFLAFAKDFINAHSESQEAAIPNVRCFKDYGEDLIKGLGYELNHQYDHDQYHTNRYRKGLLIVEFTYLTEELLTVELIIDETYCKAITFEELKVLTPVLGD